MRNLKQLLVILLASSLVLPISSVFGSSVMWSRFYGSGKIGGKICAYSVVEASDGGFVIAGYTGDYGAGGNDFWLMKTDANGNMEWNQTYGGIESDMAYSVVETSNGEYVLAGGTASFGAGDNDFWLVKTDSNGFMQWNKTYGGPDSEEAFSLVETSDGGFALAGIGDGNFLLVKTDLNGNLEWNMTYGEVIREIVHTVVESSDGGYVLAGDIQLIKTDAQGNIEWTRTILRGGARSLIKTSDGGYALVGGSWLIKTNALGFMEWKKTDVGTVARSLVETSDGGYALAGEIELVKINSQGNIEWKQTYDDGPFVTTYSLIETSDRGYALAGSNWDIIFDYLTAWVVKTDEFGIVPEFSSWAILPLFLMATMVGVLVRKRLMRTRTSIS